MILLALTARPSYAKLKSVLAALVARRAPVHVLLAGASLLDRYGAVAETVQEDFPSLPTTPLWSTYEGATRLTVAKETGALLVEASTTMARLQPSHLVIVADRPEVLALATAARYLEIPLVHLQGGERSGSLDDTVRDAVTALATTHCVCTLQAQRAVLRQSRTTGPVYLTGCPSIDLAAQALTHPPVTDQELGGAGPVLDLTRPFIVCLQHPVSQESHHAYQQMQTTLVALSATHLPRIVFWPGENAGMEGTSKAIRVHLAQHQHQTWRTVRSLPPERFLRLLTQASCLVGNSSAGIREASFLGTPVVNIGTRQSGRETAGNVRACDYQASAIQGAISHQLQHGPYPSSPLYGTGHAGQQIAEILWPTPP